MMSPRSVLYVYFQLLFFLIPVLLYSKSSCAQQDHLQARDFLERIQSDSQQVVVDVRTPEEYTKGHVRGALNINWNDPGFKKRVSLLDKNKHLYVYCLSGGRSAKAAKKLRGMGFSRVYEMDGGMLKWRTAGLPEERSRNNDTSVSGLSVAAFGELIRSPKPVLVDFYAEWCGPCKLMEPYLREMDSTMKDRVKVIRIDVDRNEQLAEKLGIDALPVLHIYRDGQLSWSNIGYIKKDDVLKILKN
jgi:thioredoxin